MSKCYALVAGVCVWVLVICGYSQGAQSERWDIKAIRDVKLWHPIVLFVVDSRSQEQPEDIDKMIQNTTPTEKTNVNWAVDLIVLKTYACATSKEGADTAISLLRKVADKFGEHPSYVKSSSFYPSLPRRQMWIDPYWLMTVRGLVFFNPDGSVRTKRPLGSGSSNGNFNAEERACLNYFNHLQV